MYQGGCVFPFFIWGVRHFIGVILRGLCGIRFGNEGLRPLPRDDAPAPPSLPKYKGGEGFHAPALNNTGDGEGFALYIKGGAVQLLGREA